jgi:hypothetical protein
MNFEAIQQVTYTEYGELKYLYFKFKKPIVFYYTYLDCKNEINAISDTYLIACLKPLIKQILIKKLLDKNIENSKKDFAISKISVIFGNN